ncbi:hypothetical protein, partial [Pseudomonas sp. GL-B-19]|uniref:hypothetical protein n=1 Tax=Pseudomonas sp. GL-B-19 TaxID=2832393 RepID=UPI001CC0F1A6
NPGKNTAGRVAGEATLDTLEIIRQTETVLAWMVDNQLDIRTALSMTTDVYSPIFTPELHNFTHNLYTSLIGDSVASSHQTNEPISPELAKRLHQAIAPVFKSKPNVMGKLLQWQDFFFRTADGTAAYGLGDFWADVIRVHGTEPEESDSQASANIARYSQGMAQYALISQWADLTEQDLYLIVDCPSWFMPDAGVEPSMPLLLRIARLKQWLSRIVVPASEAFGYFEMANQQGQVPVQALAALATIHGWDSKKTVLMNSYLISKNIYQGFPKYLDDVFHLETWMQASAHLNVGSNCIAQLFEMSRPQSVHPGLSNLIRGVAEQLSAAIKN